MAAWCSIVAVIAACVTGCSAVPREAGAPLPELTRDMAEATFRKVVDGVSESGVTGFCSRHVRSTGSCAMLLDDALKWCLLPGDKPRVERAARIPQKGRSEGGWLLELHGRTADGQPYVSEFFVVRSAGEPPQAAFGVYWAGLGLAGSPFGPGNTKIPRHACPSSS
ncbi:hypothetical protein [Streptosporangium saharense]|uniref:hypothetical protein n=1 Tax=Streptosporangium saharense TaxID=1706840 RepID=UPI00343B2B26